MRILIIQHKYDTPIAKGYLLGVLCNYWTDQGHEVIRVSGLDAQLPKTDLAILHVDLTVIPDEYLNILDTLPLTINGNIHDISKDLYSDLIVSQDDNFEGEVIVKTKANCGALLEYRIKCIENNIQPFQEKTIPWANVEYMPSYFIFKSIAEVPCDIWLNNNLIVEKFVPCQAEDGFFQIRIWIFLGEQEIHYQSTSNSRIIKGDNTLKRDILAVEDVPQSLRNMRKKLKLDYGKFDYILHNGKATLLDVNKTPGMPQGTSKMGKESQILTEILSRGIFDFSSRNFCSV